MVGTRTYTWYIPKVKAQINHWVVSKMICFDCRFVPLPFPVVLRLFPWIRSCHDDIPETDVGVEVGKVGDAAGNTH